MRKSFFRQNIYRQFAVNPAAVAEKEPFMGDTVEKEHALISDVYYSYTHGCVVCTTVNIAVKIEEMERSSAH